MNVDIYTYSLIHLNTIKLHLTLFFCFDKNKTIFIHPKTSVLSKYYESEILAMKVLTKATRDE